MHGSYSIKSCQNIYNFYAHRVLLSDIIEQETGRLLRNEKSFSKFFSKKHDTFLRTTNAFKSGNKKRYIPCGVYLWISGFLKQASSPDSAKTNIKEAARLSLSGKKYILFKEPGLRSRFV